MTLGPAACTIKLFKNITSKHITVNGSTLVRSLSVQKNSNVNKTQQLLAGNGNRFNSVP